MSAPAASLWDWAVAAYARPGVADACLALQDDHDLNVPLLLAAAWTAEQGLDADWTAAADLCRAWDNAAGLALRSARRGTKAPLPGLSDQGRERLRGQIKAAELAGERLLLDGLQDLAQRAGAHHDMLKTLTAAAGAYMDDTPPSLALTRLAAALGEGRL